MLPVYEWYLFVAHTSVFVQLDKLVQKLKKKNVLRKLFSSKFHGCIYRIINLCVIIDILNILYLSYRF